MKDLWALRLQLLRDLLESSLEDEKVFSSQTDVDGSPDKGEPSRRTYQMRLLPRLIESLGLCYMAMILLRLPISLGDLHRWAIREDIPFIRAIRHVPNPLKQRLPAELHHALDTVSALEPDDLRITIHRMCLFYKKNLGLDLPPLNAPLILFKYLRALALPSKQSMELVK